MFVILQVRYGWACERRDHVNGIAKRNGFPPFLLHKYIRCLNNGDRDCQTRISSPAQYVYLLCVYARKWFTFKQYVHFKRHCVKQNFYLKSAANPSVSSIVRHVQNEIFSLPTLQWAEVNSMESVGISH